MVFWEYIEVTKKLRYLIGSWVVLNVTIFTTNFLYCFASESTQRPQTPEATRFKESATEVAQAYTQPTNGTLLTLRNQPTFNLPTQGAV